MAGTLVYNPRLRGSRPATPYYDALSENSTIFPKAEKNASKDRRYTVPIQSAGIEKGQKEAKTVEISKKGDFFKKFKKFQTNLQIKNR